MPQDVCGIPSARKHSMARYTTTVATSLSRDIAFEYMSDVTRFKDWDPGVLNAVQVSGAGCSVGAEYELTVKAGGTTKMRYKVVEYDQPHSLRLVAKTPFLTSNDHIRVLKSELSHCKHQFHHCKHGRDG